MRNIGLAMQLNIDRYKGIMNILSSIRIINNSDSV